MQFCHVSSCPLDLSHRLINRYFPKNFIAPLSDIPMFYIKYLTMRKVHMHTGAIRQLLYCCAYVWEIIIRLSSWIILPYIRTNHTITYTCCSNCVFKLGKMSIYYQNIMSVKISRAFAYGSLKLYPFFLHAHD